MGINRSPLPWKYGNLPLNSNWGNFYGNFARFIIRNYPNLFSNYHPKYTFWVIYPFLMNLGKFIYEVTFPKHYLIVPAFVNN